MFYIKFITLCREMGISPSKAADKMGISRSTVTQWKNKGYSPRVDLLQTVADFFGVSTYFLLTDENELSDSGKVDERISIEKVDNIHKKTLDEQLMGINFALYSESQELSEHDKQDVLDFIRFKKDQYEKKSKEGEKSS